MTYCRFFFCLALLFSLYMNPAHASFWLSCKVKADIRPADTGGQYVLRIHSAIVRDGHSAKGSPCLQSQIGTEITVPIEGKNVPIGKNKTLKYDFYNGRGPNGVVEDETWSIPGFLW